VGKGARAPCPPSLRDYALRIPVGIGILFAKLEEFDDEDADARKAYACEEPGIGADEVEQGLRGRDVAAGLSRRG